MSPKTSKQFLLCRSPNYKTPLYSFLIPPTIIGGVQSLVIGPGYVSFMSLQPMPIVNCDFVITLAYLKKPNRSTFNDQAPRSLWYVNWVFPYSLYISSHPPEYVLQKIIPKWWKQNFLLKSFHKSKSKRREKSEAHTSPKSQKSAF